MKSFNPLLIGEAAPPDNSSTEEFWYMVSEFQSPSHRGGGAAFANQTTPLGTEFNLFQSPSHRGGGAACSTGSISGQTLRCFNPLLIGEAAPPYRLRSSNYARPIRFNPLLIGEAAPPKSKPNRQPTPQHRFNPLLIGEAAPPFGSFDVDPARRSVSIPFSSGRRRRPYRKQVLTILSL